MMIAFLFLVTACFYATSSANPFPPISDDSTKVDLFGHNSGSGDDPNSAKPDFKSTVPSYQSNEEDLANLIGVSSGTFDLSDASASSTTPTNVFGSTISQINSYTNGQHVSIPQQAASTSSQDVPGLQNIELHGVSDSQDLSSAKIQSYTIASSEIIPSIPVQPDQNSGSSQVQTTKPNVLPSGPDNPAELADSDESRRIALSNGDFPDFPFVGPIMNGIDWIQQNVPDLFDWAGSFGTGIPKCDNYRFSFCCYLPAPNKNGNNRQFILSQHADTRRQCEKVIPGTVCPLNNLFCCSCLDARSRGWAYLCYNPYYRARSQEAPDPDPKPKFSSPQGNPGSQPGTAGRQSPQSPKAKRESTRQDRPRIDNLIIEEESGGSDIRRRQSNVAQSNPGKPGRPRDPWTCDPDWLFNTYGIGKPSIQQPAEQPQTDKHEN